MNFTDKTQTLDHLLRLIKGENAGNVKILSGRIYVSERTLRRHISALRNMGHEIGYCMRRRTYYYIDKTDSQK